MAGVVAGHLTCAYRDVLLDAGKTINQAIYLGGFCFSEWFIQNSAIPQMLLYPFDKTFS